MQRQQSVAAGDKIEIDYQTRADVLPATMRSIESQLVYSPVGFEATAYINTPADEILNLRAHRTNILDEDQSQVTSTHRENFQNRGCTVTVIATSKVQACQTGVFKQRAPVESRCRCGHFHLCERWTNTDYLKASRYQYYRNAPQH